MGRKKAAETDGPLHVGDWVTRHPATLFGTETPLNRKLLKCQVVYIHPRGRYHVVDFGGVRESFPGARWLLPPYASSSKELRN